LTTSHYTQKNHFEHREQLEKLFYRLRNAGLRVNLSKCEFGATNINCLGFRLMPEGILPGIDKFKAVRDSKLPSTLQGIRQFMDLCNFFRSQVPNFATIIDPLNRLTFKEASWKGGDLPSNCQESFNSFRNALVS
jgi:hypothetical protein